MKSSDSEKKELIQAEEQPVKRKRGRPFGSKDSHKRYYTYSDEEILKRKQMTEKTYASGAISESDHEYNVKQINHIMKILEIAKQADVNDINTLRSCFMNYVKLCQEDGYKLGNIAAAASLGISYQTLNNWAKNVNRPEHKELAEVIKIACSMAREGLISDNKINPVIGIFWQRNFDGLRNDTEQIQSVNSEENNDNMTSKEYIEKYGKLLEE